MAAWRRVVVRLRRVALMRWGDRPRCSLFIATAGLFLVLSTSGTTHARADLSEANALFHAGDFLAAAEQAERVGSARALALAAHALCVHGYHFAAEAKRKLLYERAVELGERAVALDPDYAQAHFQLAHAIGRYAEQLGAVDALSQGFASRMRASIDAGLERTSGDAFGHLLLANWHAGIIDAAGFLGGLIYGADRDAAFAHFTRAVEIAPNSALVRVTYAEALLMLDADEHRHAAVAQLNAAIDMAPSDALERLFVQRGVQLLASMAPGTP